MKTHECKHFGGAIMMVGPSSEFDDATIERKRAALARAWRCCKDQVTDYEAIDVLRREAIRP